MALVETEGLILRCYDLSDADKIVVSLTETEGLVRGVAKGAKRLKSKFGSSLEPFSIVQLTYFQKEEKELVSIRNIELKTSYFANSSDTAFLQKFSYLADLLTKFAPPHDPNKRLYNMSKICLETGAKNVDALEGIALYFEYWILKLGGYIPDWKTCVKCSKFLDDEQTSNLQLDFNLKCSTCSNGKSVQSVSHGERELFIKVQKTSPERFVEFSKGRNQDISGISSILKRIIARVIDKEFVAETNLNVVV